jgi:hypothetical protein
MELNRINGSRNIPILEDGTIGREEEEGPRWGGRIEINLDREVTSLGVQLALRIAHEDIVKIH